MKSMKQHLFCINIVLKVILLFDLYRILEIQPKFFLNFQTKSYKNTRTYYFMKFGIKLSLLLVLAMFSTPVLAESAETAEVVKADDYQDQTLVLNSSLYFNDTLTHEIVNTVKNCHQISTKTCNNYPSNS